ncbi:MAG: hypothetical protein OEV73_08105 [Desulfobulbaceae bacterium]|nr:hypothetical protein [Desulfobulbaceae bacterium]
MASRELGIMAGFMAVSRILATVGDAERPTTKQGCELVLPTHRQQARALENYLAIPTFIRQGRCIKL